MQKPKLRDVLEFYGIKTLHVSNKAFQYVKEIAM